LLFSILNYFVISYAVNKVNGAKTLVIDPYMSGALNLVTDVSVLKVVDCLVLFCLMKS